MCLLLNTCEPKRKAESEGFLVLKIGKFKVFSFTVIKHSRFVRQTKNL